jgi:hypothetical protein
VGRDILRDTIEYNRIWTCVRTEHPEFITNSNYGCQVITKKLLNQIYALNRNYP